MTPRNRRVIPPIKGLLEPEQSPTARQAMGLLWHIPEQEKPKRSSIEIKKKEKRK